MKLALNHLKSVTCVVAVTLAMLAGNVHAQQATSPAGQGFSFDVYGDSRSMMTCLQADQEAEARKMMVDMFELVLPKKVADATVKKDVKLIYDHTKELIQMVMPFLTASEVTTLTLDKGWVTEASVEDVKLLPGVRRKVFRLEGGDWVTREVVKDVQGSAPNSY